VNSPGTTDYIIPVDGVGTGPIPNAAREAAGSPAIGGLRMNHRMPLFIAMLAVTTLCAISPAWAAGDDAKKILVVASVDSVTTWDPCASYSTEIAYFTNFYEGLVRATPPGSPKPFEPLLAVSWKTSADGLVWTFSLRKGVKFHDGTAFNADAVKYSFDRTKKLGLGAAYILDPIKEIKVLDDYTVEFRLSSMAPLDRIVASSYGAWIFSPAATRDKPREWFEEGHEAGTGPYVLQSWKPDQSLLMGKFDAYWGGWSKPGVDRVAITIVKDPVVMQNMLEAGQADMVTLIPTEALDRVDKRPDCKVLIGPSFMNYAIHINTQRPPLDNPLVRQAISYAIPYKDIIRVSVTDRLGRQAMGPIPEGEFGHDGNLMQYSYDLPKAKDLMKKAGFADGIQRPLVFTYAAENAAHAAYAPLVKESLAKIGIAVEVRPILWNAQWEMMKGDQSKAQDLGALLWWPTLNDAYETLSSLWHSEAKPYFNFAYYKNAEFDSLVDKGYVASSGAETLKLYKQAQEILLREAPSIYLFDVANALPMRENIQGFVINPSYPKAMYFYGVSKQ
jgi:peptide/nickel transport system substrate-binding protein